MRLRSVRPLAEGCLTALAVMTGIPTSTPAQVSARLFRQPDVSASHIALVYVGDVRIVPKTGGAAQRLSSPRGEESLPRFSPDGAHLAYSANYDGNQDVYVVAVSGGLPERLP